MLSDTQLLRYQRQIFLPDIDIQGQERLLNARIAVIGAGGLGAAVMPLLVGAGVGSIELWDGDTVDVSNLHRQTLYRQGDIGRNKAQAAADSLQQLNGDVALIVRNEMLVHPEQLGQYDMVLDCTDNLAVRTLVNRYAVDQQVPLVSGAATAMAGQVALYALDQPDAPCWQCVFPEVSDHQLTCRETGVLGPVVHIIGAMQAQLALLHLLGLGEANTALHLFEGKTMAWRKIVVKQNPDCPVHGQLIAR